MDISCHSSNYWGYPYACTIGYHPNQLHIMLPSQPIAEDPWHLVFNHMSSHDKVTVFSNFLQISFFVFFFFCLTYIFLTKIHLCYCMYGIEWIIQNLVEMQTLHNLLAAFTSKMAFIQTSILVYANLISCCSKITSHSMSCTFYTNNLHCEC